jgi:hypothetical protein
VPVEKERWRFFAPFSKEYDADAALSAVGELKETKDKPKVAALKQFRAKMVARLNGLFDGAVAAESFRLSLSYLYGAVKGKETTHRVVVIDGDYLDLRNDLDAKAIPERKTRQEKAQKDNTNTDKNVFQEMKPDDGPHGFVEHLACMGDGAGLNGFHAVLLRSTSAYANEHGASFNQAALKTLLRAAIKAAPKDPKRDPATIKRYLSDGYLNPIIRSAIDKYADDTAEPEDKDKPYMTNDEAAAIKAAVDDTKQAMTGKDNNVGVSLADFYALMPSHDYIFTPSRETWPASSVNSRIRPLPLKNKNKNGKPALDKKGKQLFIKASTWLDQNRPVEMMTWAPGMPLVVANKLIAEGGWVERQGVATFNLYRPPSIVHGVAKKAKPWIDLVRKVYPDDADEIINFFAHRVQKPEEKINHALVLGGEPGIGKDTILEVLKQAAGSWNFKEVAPTDMIGPHNDFMRSVVLRISEVRDLGEVNRFTFFDHMLTIIATPPDVKRVNAKYMPQHYVLNVCGVIYTTNYKTNGIYLPANDRRHHVAWSDLTMADFPEGHWLNFWNWYLHQDGLRHVAAYLAKRDLSGFDAKAPPKKTSAFWAIVDANATPEESELADTIDKVGTGQNVDAITLLTVRNHAVGEFLEWLKDRKNRRAIPHRFEKCGYVPVRSSTDDGLWVINGKRQVVYARKELNLKEQHRAAQKLIKAKTKTDPDKLK